MIYRIHLLVNFSFFFLLFTLKAVAGDFIKTVDGIIVRPDAAFSGNAKEVRLTVVTENIIRVTAIADTNMQQTKRLITIPHGRELAKFTVESSQNTDSVKTANITALVNLQTGRISFFDAFGKMILEEKQLGRSLQPQVFDGERLYSIQQDFITTNNDAWYGLGQHQDGLMNYKTYQVQLFQ